MTATMKPPAKHVPPRDPMRMSWMEILGFAEASDSWSDRPENGVEAIQHAIRLSPTADTLADWQPEDVGRRLNTGSVRWGLLATVVIIVVSVTYAGLWLYQRPAAVAEAASANVAAEATTLASQLPALVTASGALVGGSSVDTDVLVSIDSAARGLFEASSSLEDDQTTRSAAADAASMTLDAVRLISDANAYRLAVTPILAVPELETDPSLIELDEAARSFGEWQLRFDTVRTALPDGVLPDVTTQLDVLSANLTTSLEAYVDALREDDAPGVVEALRLLSQELDDVSSQMAVALGEVSDRALARIEDARESLDLLVG